jgi:hypothetical protein
VSSGGDLKQGLISGLTAGAFGGLHDLGVATTLAKVGKVAAHGAVGGLSAAASGGSFKSGFLSAAFTQGASQNGGIGNLKFSENQQIGTLNKAITTLQRAKNAALAAVVGGAGAVIGGGKFKNGAITGAFSRLFNDDKTVNDLLNSEGDGPIDVLELEGIDGAHTRAKHIGLSERQLRLLMNVGVQKGPGITDFPKSVSSFSSVESANKLISSALSANQVEIRNFLASGQKGAKAFHKRFSSVTGTVASRPGRVGRRLTKTSILDGGGVRLIIRSSGNGTGTLHSAFPIP